MTANEIATDLARFIHADQVTELRALHVGGKGRTFAGWFDGSHLFDLARNALALTRQASAVYFIPNPVNPDLASKRLNTVMNVPRGFGLTHDTDIIERQFLIVDIDPRRFHRDVSNDDQDCASTSRELIHARRTADQFIRPFLAANGYAPPIVMCSGNGIHLVYRNSTPLACAGWGGMSDPAADTLRFLADRFSCIGLSIDPNTFNPCRMLKVPGTYARKGEPTRSRPHRLARILEVPNEWRQPDPPSASTGNGQSAKQLHPGRNMEAKAAPRKPPRTVEQSRLFDPGTDNAALH